MKKNVIALLLAVVMASGSIGSVPALAAETTAQEAVAVEEETVEEATDVSEETDAIEASETTAEETVDVEEGTVDSEEAPVESEVGVTDESTEDASEEKSAEEVEAEPEQDLTETVEEAEEVETTENEEPAVAEEEVIESEAKEAALAEGDDVVASGTCGDNLTWTLTGTEPDLTLTISGSGKMIDWSHNNVVSVDPPWYSRRLSIKTVIVENGVTSIGNDAFNDCRSLTSITIPNSVTSIGNSAFPGCSSLTSIMIPDSVTSIGDYAFSSCSNLTSITIPNSVTSIGGGAFYGCITLASVTIPDSVTSIGPYVFRDCSSLTSITIPNSVTSIGNDAFNCCSSLTSITIPDSVTSIEKGLFYGCRSLTSITIPDSVTSIGDIAFEGCRSLASITIPDSVTSIGGCAFGGCSSLTGITIPDSVTSIGSNAFEDCSSLTSITIPNGVTIIGEDTFKGCSSLTSITIPGSVTSMGDYAFSGCSRLTSITILNGVTSIGNYTFENCNNLTSITIPNSVTSIGIYAFWKCSSLTSITIPNSVTSIGNCTFENCNNLTSITIPDSVTRIGAYVFRNCRSLTSITIPGSVTSIGEGAFSSCSSLASVTIPNSVTSIGGFYGCSSLTSITIPDSVTSIERGAFSGCSSLTSITIPDSVTSIGDYAFSGCSSLTSITIPDSVTSIKNYAFNECKMLIVYSSNDNVFSYCRNNSIKCCPYIEKLSPEPYTKDVDVNSTELVFCADFMCNIAYNDGFAYLFEVGIDNTPVDEIFLGEPDEGKCSIENGNRLILHFSLDKLKKGKSYYIRIEENAIKLLDQNKSFPGLAKDIWTFSIGGLFAVKELYPEPGAEYVDYTHPIRIVFDKSIIANNGYAYLYEEGKNDPVDKILLDDDYVTMYSYGQSKDNLQLVFPNVVKGKECIRSGKKYYIVITENALKISDEQGSSGFPGIKGQVWKFSTIDQEYASFTNRGDEISYELFRHVFKAPLITEHMYNNESYRLPGGVCHGMAYVSGAKKNNFGLASQFKELYSYDFNSTEKINAGFTLSEYIKMAYLYQKRDDQLQEVIDTTNKYSEIVNAIRANKPIILAIWKKKNILGKREGQHALLPVKILDDLSTDSEIKVLVYDCNGVTKEYDDSRFNGKSFLSILTIKKNGDKIVGFEYKDDSNYSNKYDCIAATGLDDKFEKLITSNESLFNYREYYQGHPFLRVRQDAAIASDIIEFGSDVIEIFSSSGEESKETGEDFYWVKGSSFSNILAGDSTFSITDGYDEIEVTASKGASINIDIEDTTAKVVNTDASAPNYTITHTHAEDDNNKKSVVINGETSSTVNTEKTDDGIIVKNEDGTPVQVEIVITDNNTVVQNVETSATADSINIKVDDENTLTVTQDADSDGTYETVIVKKETAKEISGAEISGITNKTYTGKALTQSVIVKYGDAKLVQDADYTVSYKNNINAGTASVTITGKGNYSGTITKTFTINKAAQSITAKSSAATVSVGKTATVSTTGAKGAVTYSSSNTTVATVDSKTGKVTGKKVGTVTITAQSAATANYSAASVAVTIKAVPGATASLSAANLSTGIKLTWKKVVGANGYIIYRNGSKIKTITSGSTVTYTDKKANTNGTKYTYKVVAKATTGTSTLSRSRIMYRVARTAVSSLASRSAGKITVKWKRNSKANGYIVQYSKSKSFSSGNKTATITKNTLINKTIGSLTKGKKYYVRVRCFKTVSGKKYYSAWSATKAVTVKK